MNVDTSRSNEGEGRNGDAGRYITSSLQCIDGRRRKFQSKVGDLFAFNHFVYGGGKHQLMVS